MYLGIDVGGTHTDAVVMSGRKIVASAKTLTSHTDLLSSIAEVFSGVLADVPVAKIRHVNLSTTLSTNALVQNRVEEVAVVVSAGPGLDPRHFQPNDHYFSVLGAMDHRGIETAPLNDAELRTVASRCKEAGLLAAAVVGKFSPRNPAHEERMAAAFSGFMDHTTLGHRIAGRLNFPRRVATAYYNAAVWRLYNSFADAVEISLRGHGVTVPINILKADGGTMPLAASREMPIESIMSGPAASVMGIIALCDIDHDALIFDVGGTTTDIAVFVGGDAVIERDGAVLAGHDTAVRAIKTMSIGIGGDSAVSFDAGRLKVGPIRLGPCMAFGGNSPALLDAFNVLDKLELGDHEASRRGLEQLAAQSSATGEIFSAAQIAALAVSEAMEQIRVAAATVLAEINSRPIYTIRELLGHRDIAPTRGYIMGTPAAAFAPHLRRALGLDIDMPRRYAVTNAIGAALARTTTEIELFADTEQGVLLIPSLDIRRRVDLSYKLSEARADALAATGESLAAQGIAPSEAPVDILEDVSFNMVGERGLLGRNIRVRCQVRPGILDIVED